MASVKIQKGNVLGDKTQLIMTISNSNSITAVKTEEASILMRAAADNSAPAAQSIASRFGQAAKSVARTATRKPCKTCGGGRR